MLTIATPEPLTVAETADFLRLDRSTVYRRIRENTLPAVRLGYGPSAHLRIPRDELEQLVYAEPEFPGRKSP